MTIHIDTAAPHVRVFTLDRPEVLNATRVADVVELDRLLDEAEADEDVRCVVLTGAGDAFCAGHDIHEMKGLDAEALTILELRRRQATWHWANARVPTVAAINGVSYGNGTLMAVGADLRVGGPQTRMKVTATKYGGANLTWSLPALIGESHARDLLLTGRVVDGEEAYRMGLLNRFAADGAVLDAAVQLAAEIAANPPSGPVTVKHLINTSHAASRQAGFDREHAVQLDSLLGDAATDIFDGFHRRSDERRDARATGGDDGRGPTTS
jgi:2-(1,2-epoxy-1,2-dihydrophenyl)acetyl-CoA isomerase